MCGIIGFVNPEMDDKKTAINKMMDTIKHRGPNSSGEYTNDEVALGFRRLSIIDLTGGMQPIYNEDHSRAITFNGEIYNYQEIREELIQAGHVFTTKSDTEVLLHGYEEYGMDGLLQKVRGMFGFMIWDDNIKTLFGARDFFGIKPLYYYQDGQELIVGSEIKSFLAYPGFVKELNMTAVKPYLMNQYNDLNETFFKGVHKFPAGNWFSFKDGQMDINQYWDASYVENSLSFEETVERIQDSIEESVALHNIADVPVGSFLSEGIDSSYVTSVLKPEKVFSIGFDDRTFDEVKNARDLAKLKNFEFYEDRVSGAEAFRDFPEMQYHMDEPDANPSVVPLWYLTKLARKHVTVALSGEGADELFAGYVNYGMHTHNSVIKVFTAGLKKLPKGIKGKLARGVRKLSDFHGKVNFYTNLAEPSEYFVGQSVIYDMNYPTVFTAKDANDILQPTYRNKLTTNLLYKKDFVKVKDADAVKQMQYIDLHHFLVNDILQKADKISMAHSLELRVPYLDRKVAELANSIPTSYLMNSHDTKYALREASKSVLPASWSNRPKLGFPVPVKEWLHDEQYYKQIRELFAEPFVNDIFDQEKVLQLLDDNYHGDGSKRRQVWTVFTFLTWYKLYFVDYENTVKKYQRIQPEVEELQEQGLLVNTWLEKSLKEKPPVWGLFYDEWEEEYLRAFSLAKKLSINYPLP